MCLLQYNNQLESNVPLLEHSWLALMPVTVNVCMQHTRSPVMNS